MLIVRFSRKRWSAVLATTYAAVTRKSPVGNTYSAGLDPKLAGFLQTTAWQTAQEYYGKQD